MDGDKPIGIFDSGIGGLTVARKIFSELSNEKIIYFGDTARAPYGTRTKENITEFSLQIMRFLTENNIKLAIIACNTICAACYDELCENFDIPIFEIISPAAEDCVKNTDSKCIGVIATDSTVKSRAYEQEILKLSPNSRVLQQACPDFVTLSEEGNAETPAGDQLCEFYLKDLKKEGIDSLILGCTHFPLYQKGISNYLGSSVKLIDPADAVTQKTKKYLDENSLSRNEVSPPIHEFYVSGDTHKFESIGTKLTRMEIKANKAYISDY